MRLLALLLIAILFQQVNAQGPVPKIVSPEVLSDHSVIFRIKAPEAKSVKLSGSMLPGFSSVEMIKNETGVFELKIGPVESDLHTYMFSVDGVRTIDPSNGIVVRDGSYNESRLMIPGALTDLFDVQDVPHGKVSAVWYPSKSLGLTRRCMIYTPPGYDSSSESYPVFYLLHGSGGDEEAWIDRGRANYIFDNLIAQGKAKPMIVVLTNGNASETSAPGETRLSSILQRNAGAANPAAGTTDPTLFPQSLVKDVIPFVEKNYRVIANKNNRAISGLSMGGAHTAMASNLNPGVFGYIGVFSSGPREKYRIEYDNTFKTQLAALKGSVNLYYLGCGVDDGAIAGTNNLETSLKENGMNYKYSKTPGGHTWNNWRIYLSEFTPMLFK